MRLSSITAGGLRWLKSSQAYSVQLIILKGFETINFASAYGSGAATGYGPCNFDYDLYQRLIPRPVADWDPEIAKNRCAPPHYTERIFGWDPGFDNIVSDNLLPKVLMQPKEIMQWLLSEMQSLRLKNDRYEGLFKDPTKLIRLGYKLAIVAGRRFPLNSSAFAAALCMVGLGSMNYDQEKPCPNCFRIALPLIGRCKQHSQSKYTFHDTGSRSQHSQDARTGRRVMSELKWDKNAPSALLPYLCINEWVTAGMLWPLQGQQHRYWNFLIAEALKNAPLISQLLPQDFLYLSNTEQLTLLRATLDENEWVISRWPQKIALAQEWLEKKNIIAPGPKPGGLSEVNKERLKQAQTLKELGFKQYEIAKQLGITAAHLSQLLRRQKAPQR